MEALFHWAVHAGSPAGAERARSLARPATPRAETRRRRSERGGDGRGVAARRGVRRGAGRERRTRGPTGLAARAPSPPSGSPPLSPRRRGPASGWESRGPSPSPRPSESSASGPAVRPAPRGTPLGEEKRTARTAARTTSVARARGPLLPSLLFLPRRARFHRWLKPGLVPPGSPPSAGLPPGAGHRLLHSRCLRPPPPIDAP